MAKYAISVREILDRTVIVEADNSEEALEKVENAVNEEKIILNADDYNGRVIIPSTYFEDDGKVSEGEDVSYYWHLKDNT